MPDLTRVGGGDLGTSTLLAWCARVGEPGLVAARCAQEPVRGPHRLFGRLVTRVGWLSALAGRIAMVAGVLA
jgi:hypothetical protein